MKRKRGQQSGNEAAILVLIITVMIIVFVMFLPAEERSELLDDYDTTYGEHDDDDDDDDYKYNLTLVDESPGRLDDLKNLEYEHDIPAINLYTKTNAEVIKDIPSFVIKNNWFEKKSELITFEIDDMDNIDNLQLSFLAKKHKGTLLILLNGQKVYEGVSDTPTIPPVTLQKNSLQKTNTLEFYVSDVGLMFWRTNMFAFENMLITADITDTTGHRSENTFKITATEFHNLDSAVLKFVPDCSVTEVGTLDVKVNGEHVYSSVPDCGAWIPPIDITESIKLGRNDLSFSTTKGKILLDNIRVDTKLKELIYPVYYFELSDEEYYDIINEDAELNMTLKFTDYNNYKEARIFINSHLTYMTTKESEFVANLKPYVEKKTNSIKIEPYGDTLDIRHLLVVLR